MNIQHLFDTCKADLSDRCVCALAVLVAAGAAGWLASSVMFCGTFSAF